MNQEKQPTARDYVPLDSVAIDLDATRDRSHAFVGKWNRLISQTNWEKGQIICDWKSDLQQQEQPASVWSDETWSRLVGGVSPQHVGRLRRTWDRFGTTFQTYQGLYWSHFCAALEWDDAEMWLEGAVQSSWSVSRMRLQRWESTGAKPEDKPSSNESDIVSAEIAEENQSLVAEDAPSRSREKFSSEPLDEGPDFGGGARSGTGRDDSESIEMVDIPKLSSQALFEKFQDLPEDVSEAVEAFKICIIRHRADGWSQIDQQQLVDVLAALRQLAASNADAHG